MAKSNKPNPKKEKKTSKNKQTKKTNKQTESKKMSSSKKENNKKIAEKLAKKSDAKSSKSQKESVLGKNFAPVLNTPTIVALVVIILIGLAYIFRGYYIAALVNGQPISRLNIMQESEKRQGAQILEQQVLEQLVIQKAREEGIQISDELVDTQIDQIKQEVAAQGQDFEQLLQMQGMTEEELRRQIRLQQMVEQLVGSEVQVTDEEVEQYLEANSEFLPEESSQEELEEIARQQLEQQKLSNQYQDWIEQLKQDARIQYFVDYAPEEELTTDDIQIETEAEMDEEAEMDSETDAN